MNLFPAQGTISSGIVEGTNNKAKLMMHRACGFRTCKAAEVALYHDFGDLPEHHFTHGYGVEVKICARRPHHGLGYGQRPC